MSTPPLRLVKTEEYKGTMCLCFHCSSKFGTPNGACAQFCGNCKRAEQRAEMDRTNKEINPSYRCEYCEAEMEQKKEQKEEKK